jgi:hypothetical protein
MSHLIPGDSGDADVAILSDKLEVCTVVVIGRPRHHI